MCTTASKKIGTDWYLIKTRDPVPWMRWDDEIKLFNSKIDKYKKLIIQNPNHKEDGYYGGINERGVAYVSTFVRVAEDQVSYIRRPYVRLILDAPTATALVSPLASILATPELVEDQTTVAVISSVEESVYVPMAVY